MEVGEINVDLPEAKLEETRRLIEEEIKHDLQAFKNSDDYKTPFHITEEEYDEEIRMGYGLGLMKYLPYSPSRKIFIDTYEKKNIYDTPTRILEPSAVNPLTRQELDERHRRHSELYLNQSLRQFLETIDKSFEVEGFSIEETKQLVEGYFSHRIPGVEFYRRILPVYIRLRAIGYTLRDFGS